MKVFLVILLVFLLFFSSCNYADFEGLEESFEIVCSDGYCDEGEDCSTCPDDCGLCEEDLLAGLEETNVFVQYSVLARDFDGVVQEFSYTGSGVLYLKNNSQYSVLTNRHVVDCEYNYDCASRIQESITVRTNDGELYDVQSVAFALHDLDAAELLFFSEKEYPTILFQSEVILGEWVYAVGYPSFTDRVVELSLSAGNVSNVNRLLMTDGFAFQAIESDAYIDFGSSGGGLFDVEGGLLGITTWGDGDYGYAIKIDSIIEASPFNWCDKGSYLNNYGDCILYEYDDYRDLCFVTDEYADVLIDGHAFYNGKSIGKTKNGCVRIAMGDLTLEGEVRLIDTFSAGFLENFWSYGPSDAKDAYVMYLRVS